MKLFSSSRTQRAVIASAFFILIAVVGIGLGLYLNQSSQETRSSAYEDTSCIPDERTSCIKSFGTCSVNGTKTCQSDGTWGLCTAEDPRLDNCSEKECGNDGCGGVCGSCHEGESCTAEGVCVSSESASTESTTTTESYPIVGGETVQVRISLQYRDTHNRSKIRLELIQDNEVIATKVVSSGSDGITQAWDVSSYDKETYTLRVKPLSYLSQSKEITLSDDNSLVTFVSAFAAGDLVDNDNNQWGDDIVKSFDKLFLESVYMMEYERADFDGSGYVNVRDRKILESNLLKTGSSITE